MKMQLMGMIERSWWRGLKYHMRSLSKSSGESALRKEPLVFPFPLFWGLIITEDNIGIALGSYTCADDGFTCTTLCSGHRGRSGVSFYMLHYSTSYCFFSTIYIYISCTSFWKSVQISTSIMITFQ